MDRDSQHVSALGVISGAMMILVVHRGPEPELARTLARGGHDVLVISDEQRPVRYLDVFAADVILIASPNGSGICHRLRVAAPSLPILAVCPGRAPEHRVALLEAGADDCLGTPFDQVELIARMHAVRRRRRAGRSLRPRRQPPAGLA